MTLRNTWHLAAVSCITAVSCTSAAPATQATNDFIISSETFTIEPSKERYVCYSKTLTEDVLIDHYEVKARPGVHHIFFSKTDTPEPEGVSECNALYRKTWQPLFLVGKGDAHLTVPDGSAQELKKGTQLVLQLHLLNATKEPLQDKVSIVMRRSNATKYAPVGIYAFGSMDFQLPPLQVGTVVNDCVLPKDVDIYAQFAHMHLLGTSLKFETGTSEADLKTQFEATPYNFDNQAIVEKRFQLTKGTFTRTTCTYQNSTKETVEFGESSLSEMCFMIGFATGVSLGADGCVKVAKTEPGDYPPNPAAGKCGEQIPTSTGIGEKCTKGGNECKSGLSCTLDQSQTPEGSPGFCFKIGCATSAECGGGFNTCCAPKEAGGLINVCMPEACRAPTCAPKN